LYRGLRTIELKANLGVDFQLIRWRETKEKIEVFGFKRTHAFEHIGRRHWRYKEIRDKNVFGQSVVHDDHKLLHRCTEKQDCELTERINDQANLAAYFEQFDALLKEACRKLIWLTFKGSQKPIEFLEGEPPSDTTAFLDRLSSVRRDESKSLYLQP
jgi:hypothetical protein